MSIAAPRITLTRRAKIQEAYEALHGAGVVHYDVAPHHARFRPGGAACVIDFKEAICAGTPAFSAALDHERRRIAHVRKQAVRPL